MTQGSRTAPRQPVVGFVFARGGSKGVPGKNIRPIAGVPLLAYSIRAALASSYIETVVVSTDDAAIADVAIREGAHVPFLRPKELATDSAAEWSAWRHAISELVPSIPGLSGIGTFVSIPTTAPLREPKDIDRVCERLWKGDVDIVITASPAKRSPYFNMIEIVDGQARLAIEGPEVTRRQDAPEVFDVATVAYATTPRHIAASEGVFDGRVGVVVVPEQRALDIDTEWDFHLAELLLGERKDAS